SLGLLVGTVLIGVYGETSTLTVTLLESGIAIILFYLTPTKTLQKVSKFIPGTNEYSFEERKYLQKIRDVTAQRVEQFSSVFAALSESFIQSTDKTDDKNHQHETDYFLSKVRSEEHTSELQSRFDLVCRLLLEKKKQ